VLIASNKPDAGVLNIALENRIETYLLTRENLASGSFVEHLHSLNVDLIVLAGFLWKVPEQMVKRFPHKIINIHPALLPKYGGRGMYGHHVHEAVHTAREKESGITIHWVNEHYDEGTIIAQYSTPIEPNDTVADIERKVRSLEMEWFPKVIDNLLTIC
ncbi:MAG: formyltransferase family protein, partial [Flavobacteriales bacterium]